MNTPEPTEKFDTKIDNFRKELERLLNCMSTENRSDTPDFILAQYITDCLEAYDRAVNRREVWYGRKTAEPEAAQTGLADVLSYINDQSKQFRQCAGHHAEHNRGAEAVAIRAAEILDRIAADIKAANNRICDTGSRE